MTKDLVTFGIVNCNRLHYLRSCFESLFMCTEDYAAREFIVVDNASTEEGTEEYLTDLQQQGVKVFRMSVRDPANEFARGLNTVCREAQGDIIVPLQGDMQFVVLGGWLSQYVELMTSFRTSVGCITLDAQRGITNQAQLNHMQHLSSQGHPFVVNSARPPVAGAGDVMYSREILEALGPWSEDNQAHEGGQDSETDMLNRAAVYLKERGELLHCCSPMVPPAVAIYTDPRGTNARVRGNKRYGSYWPPKEDFRYYDMGSFPCPRDRMIPFSIEEMAMPLGWEKPLDAHGNWLKNPIRPETALPHEYVELAQNFPAETDSSLESWLNEVTQ